MTEERLPERPLDVMRLLDVLARHGVDYVLIGGIAVQVHGHRRTTRDLDLIPEPTAENAARLHAALVELEATPVGVLGAGVPTEEQLVKAPVVPPLTTTHGEVHILNDVPGAAPFADLRSRAEVVNLDGVSVPIVGLEDLRAMKLASGRGSDLDDLSALDQN